jgi:hypothetical protein
MHGMYVEIIADDIKSRGIGWASHMARIQDESILPKKALNGKFHNTRPVGKPRIRWQDVVRRDTS